MAKKIGEGHLEAMARLGLKELRNALNPSRESVADSEIGLYGTATIADARGGPGQGPEQESPSEKLSLDDLRTAAKEQSQLDGRNREREQDREAER
jgi:hypothetical protein